MVSSLDVVEQHAGQVGTVGALQRQHEGWQTQVSREVQLLDQSLGQERGMEGESKEKDKWREEEEGGERLK